MLISTLWHYIREELKFCFLGIFVKKKFFLSRVVSVHCRHVFVEDGNHVKVKPNATMFLVFYCVWSIMYELNFSLQLKLAVELD